MTRHRARARALALALALAAGAGATLVGCATDPGVDEPPVIEPLGLVTAEDHPIWFRLPAHDPEGQPLVRVITAPAHGVLRAAGEGWVYEPARDWSGQDRVELTVSDGRHQRTAGVTIRVVPVNDRPQALADRFSTPEDTPLVLAPELLVHNDVDVEEAHLWVSAVGDAVGGTVALVGGEVRFTPALHFAGTARFRYTVTDGVMTDQAAVVVEVGPVNDPPVARNVLTITIEDVAVDVAYESHDVDSSWVRHEVVAPPKHGKLIEYANGARYIPDPDWHGVDTFLYVAHDQQDVSAPARVRITVVGVDECGDGEIQDGEECDDGNVVDGDGCDHVCAVSACGNGIRADFQPVELELHWMATACDGPNQIAWRVGGVDVLTTEAAGEGCTCATEARSVTLRAPEVLALLGEHVDVEVSVPGRTLTAWAYAVIRDPLGERRVVVFDADGDGVGEPLCEGAPVEDAAGWTQIYLGEECDDGNLDDGDGCSAACRLELE